MAENKKDETKQAETKQERVPLFIPPDPNGETHDVYLCVNGSNMLVRSGETVNVPPEFLEAWQNAQEQLAASIRAQKQHENVD